MSDCGDVLGHFAWGIGKIVLATALLTVLPRNGFVVDLVVDAGYRDVAELFNR